MALYEVGFAVWSPWSRANTPYLVTVDAASGDAAVAQAQAGIIAQLAPTGEYTITSVRPDTDGINRQTASSAAAVSSRRNIVTPQIVAHRGMLSSTPLTSTNVSSEVKILVRNGLYPASDIRLAFSGFSIDATAAGEVVLPNDLLVMCAVEKVSPSKAIVASMNGARLITVKAGAGITLTDPVGLDFAAYEDFYVQMGVDWTQNANTYLSPINNTFASDTMYRSNVITSATWQIGTAGAWSATNRAASVNVGAPGMVIGTPTQNYPSVILLGDSIMANREDTGTGDAIGNHGFAPRGLTTGAADGGSMPYANFARSGEMASTLRNGGAANRLAMLRYCSHVIMNYGTNDIAVGGANLATLQTSLTAAWAACKRRGVQVYQVLLMPRTTSSDTWQTAANQTAVAGFDVGGVRDQINVWIKAQVGTLIDGYIDCNQYVEDPAAPSKWVSTGTANYATADGVHPSIAACALAAPAVAASARSFIMPAALRTL